MDRELGTFANAVAPGMGTASGAILSALAVRFLPDPTHLIYLALIGVLVLQAGAPEPEILARQLHLLYDGSGQSARLDHDPGAAAAARTAAAALLDVALARGAAAG